MWRVYGSINNEYTFNNLPQIMFNSCNSYDDVRISYVYHTSLPSILPDNHPDIPLLPCHTYLALHSGCYISPDSHIQNYQQGKLLKIYVTYALNEEVSMKGLLSIDSIT